MTWRRLVAYQISYSTGRLASKALFDWLVAMAGGYSCIYLFESV